MGGGLQGRSREHGEGTDIGKTTCKGKSRGGRARAEAEAEAEAGGKQQLRRHEALMGRWAAAAGIAVMWVMM